MTQDKMTIFAPATHPGKAGVAIIRISGKDSSKIFGLICNKKLPKPRTATYTKLFTPETKEIIDYSIILWFPAPHSFTGEDTIELHIHGSVAIINILLKILSNIDNFRIAEPGEFAKKAFLNGKMDLTKAEGLSDLIDSETIMQQKQAIRQLSGELENLYDSWRHAIIEILANVEAFLDFPDEDIPQNLVKQMMIKIDELKNQIFTHINDNKRGEKLKNGLYVTILGKPNVGKSTLLNYLARRDIAIVSDIAGTTRDIIEAHLDIAGYPITIADTAGIRENADIIESEGIKRALKRSKEADFNIIMFDSTTNEIDKSTFDLIDNNSIILINKIDQTNGNYTNKISNSIEISLKNMIGIDQLLTEIENRAKNLISPSSSPLITRERYRYHITKAYEYLDHFSLDDELELAAEDLRRAAVEIGKITGSIDIDDILSKIFSNFCLGK